MTTKHWLGTAAIILAIGTASGAASAQSEMKREGGGAAAAAPREAARPGADAKGGAAAAERGASEAKQSAQERRSEPSPAAGREQAQERSSERSGHDTKQPIAQGAESKGERGPASAQRDHDAKESAESKSRADSKQADKPDSKSTAADTKQQQGRADEQRKGEDRAAESKSAAPDRKSDREADRNGADKNRQSQEERKPGTSDQASDKQNADRNKQANQPGSADNKNTTAQQNQQTGPAGANASFSSSSVDNCDPRPLLECVPPSGALFAPGPTMVICRATDSSGNTNVCSFMVTVESTIPKLTIGQQGTNVVICWPVTCASFVLEETTDLRSPRSWAPVQQPKVIANTQFCVTLPVLNGNRFCRLRRN